VTSITMTPVNAADHFAYWVIDTVIEGRDMPKTVAMNGNRDVEAHFAPAVIVIETDDGDTLEYAVNGGAWKKPVKIGPRMYVITDANPGDPTELRVTADPDDEVIWNEVSPLRSTGPTYMFNADDRTVTLKIVHLTVPADYTAWILIASAIAFFMILLAMSSFRTVVRGSVKCEGMGVSGVAVEYSISGKPAETVMTDAEGNFEIRTSLGYELEIKAVQKDGYSLKEDLPEGAVIEKTTSAIEISMNRGN